MSRLNEIIDQINDIEKAWKKAEVGTVTVRSDGQTYRKVSATGDPEKDWVLVPKNNGTKQGEKTGDKNQVVKPEAKKTFTVADLEQYAKKAGESILQSVIKNSGNPKLRQAAHNELERRQNVEHPQEEDKKPVAKPESKKEEKKPESKKPETKKEEHKTPTEKVSDDIKTAFEQMSAGAKNAGILNTFERFKKGDEVVFKNPVAIKAAKESEFYNSEEQEDGSLKILGVKNPDTGEWAGVEKGGKDEKVNTNEDLLFNKLSDKSFRKLNRDAQSKLISLSSKEASSKGDKLEQNFTDKEIDAMDVYASGSYREINDYLRGNLKGDDLHPDVLKEIESTVKDIDTIISKHELKEDLVVYRGQDDSHSGKDNKAYKSTSLDPYSAYNFSRGEKPVVDRFVIPKGTNYAYMGGGEKEIIFGRDLDINKFKENTESNKQIKKGIDQWL